MLTTKRRRELYLDKLLMNHAKHREYVKRVASMVGSLPQLPTLVAKLLQLIDDPGTNASRLAKLISTDQVLYTRILRQANSAYYGCSQTISTLDMAIVILGFDLIKDLCFTTALGGWFTREKNMTSFDMSRFWKHCVTCGVASKMMARLLKYDRVSGEAFAAGLIHDIGKLVLKRYLIQEFRQIMEEVSNTGCLFVEAEERLFGTTHAAIGSLLAKHWNLPEQLVEAVEYHHDPKKSREHFTLTAFVHFANYLARIAQFGNSGDNAMPSLNKKVTKFLKLRRDDQYSIDIPFYKQALMSELQKFGEF